ncbi:hypothetical protein CPC08DRAFT_710691 [Agrocybe pediades]|nr:hypothetical protein CPC08DRAFT_710691 [Agrocybe pediades]
MARLLNITSFVFFLIAAAAAVAMPEPGSGSGGVGTQCASDSGSSGLSCCRAVPSPKCFQLPKGAVC